MKKILFVIPDYTHGGTNKTLENLLTFIDKKKYDISIYCIREDGGTYYKDVFKRFLIGKSRYYYWLHDNIITRKILALYIRLNKKANWRFLYKHEVSYLQRKYNFDLIVAYQENSPSIFCSFFENVKTISWFHSPYLRVLTRNIEYSNEIYSTYDKIVCVSDTFAKLFKETLPSQASKVVRIYNTMNAGLVNEMAKERINDTRFTTDVFSIISVGRFVPMKQFELIPSIADRIRNIDGGVLFKWFIIASGNTCKKQTIEEIKKYGLESIVIVLGPKDNPYPYIKNADLFVSTSSTESYPTVINEAKVLHTPIVSNNYPSAVEIIDESCGIICPLDDIHNQIFKLIIDENNKYSSLKKSICSYRYDNDGILQQIDNLFSI